MCWSDALNTYWLLGFVWLINSTSDPSVHSTHLGVHVKVKGGETVSENTTRATCGQKPWDVLTWCISASLWTAAYLVMYSVHCLHTHSVHLSFCFHFLFTCHIGESVPPHLSLFESFSFLLSVSKVSKCRVSVFFSWWNIFKAVTQTSVDSDSSLPSSHKLIHFLWADIRTEVCQLKST